jgi:hypothetical protein
LGAVMKTVVFGPASLGRASHAAHREIPERKKTDARGLPRAHRLQADPAPHKAAPTWSVRHSGVQLNQTEWSGE